MELEIILHFQSLVYKLYRSNTSSPLLHISSNGLCVFVKLWFNGFKKRCQSLFITFIYKGDKQRLTAFFEAIKPKLINPPLFDQNFAAFEAAATTELSSITIGTV